MGYRSNSYQVMTACSWASEVAETHAPTSEAEREALERMRALSKAEPYALIFDRGSNRKGSGFLELVAAAEDYAQRMQPTAQDAIHARDRILDACKNYRRDPRGGV